MLESITLKNFRTHKKIKVDFDSKVTSIIGPSYKGKSTILRAVKWVTQNQPSGNSMLRWTASKVMVKILIDGHTIIRKMGSGINLYKLDNQKFKAFKTSVPEPISQIINMSSINFNKNQHDVPFWFSESAGEVSRQLNSIVNLGVIDSTLSNIASTLRDNRSEIGVCTNRLEEFKKQRNELSYIKELNENLESVEILEKQHNIDSAGLARFNYLLEGIQIYQLDTKLRKEQSQCGNLAIQKAQAHSQIINRLVNLEKLISNHQELQIEIDGRPPTLNPVELAYQKYKKEAEQRQGMETIISKTKDAEEEMKTFKYGLQQAQKEFKIQTGNRCPICGKKM